VSAPERVLYDAAAIERRVVELAEAISSEYAGRGELCLVGVLKGAFIFLADLARRLTIPHRVEFVALASYGDGQVSQGVRLLLDLRTSIEGAHVLVVDDIVDTGATLHYLVEMLAARGPASLRTCVLTRKRRPGGASLEPDYLGFEIPDVWVVGYGLDLADRDRTLPYIAVSADGA
jgi:hypoxanthine phosphoribosyltransferase